MRYSILFLILLVLPFGCGQETASHSMAVETIGGAPPPQASYADVNKETAAEETVDVSSKIIKTGTLRYEVKDLDKSFAHLNQHLKKQGAFIQNDNSGSQYNYTYRNVIIRVPSRSFDQLVDAITKEVSHFTDKTITAADVTAEFIDIEARLKNKKTLENRYLELLNKTHQISEILEIEKSLSVIREEIESVEGRLNYLKNQVSYSTLTVELFQTSASGLGVTESYPGKMWQAVLSGFNSLSGFVLGLLTLWPYLIIGGVLFVLLRKTLVKRRTKSQIDKEQ